jgi:arylsulfatase A-like enzyme
MKMRGMLILAILLANPGPLCPAVYAGGSPAKPNIVLIVADDLGYADVSFNPHHPKEVSTPNLDALARAGVICRQGYVTGNVCSPTRAGLMTGRYQQRVGIYTGGEGGSGLSLTEKIFPQFLRRAGYRSMAFGKWHLGLTRDYNPTARGFDDFYGFLGRGAHDYFKLDDENSPLYRGLVPIKDKGYLTDRLSDEAVAFIKGNKDRPFFAYLAYNAVHYPMQAPEESIKLFNTGDPTRDRLLAMLKHMDGGIGRVVASLKQERVWDNTLIFFISDNGGAPNNHSNNAPLRGHKHQDFEGGVRVPFLVCWPAKLKAGGTFDAPVSALDILPTALAAAGIDLPSDRPLDGRDLLPLFSGTARPEPRNLFWCNGAAGGWWAVRSSDWKLVAQKGKVHLFNLQKDPSETKDLAAQVPERVAELTRLHDDWLREMAVPLHGGAKRFGLEGASPPKKKKRKAGS